MNALIEEMKLLGAAHSADCFGVAVGMYIFNDGEARIRHQKATTLSCVVPGATVVPWPKTGRLCIQAVSQTLDTLRLRFLVSSGVMSEFSSIGVTLGQAAPGLRYMRVVIDTLSDRGVIQSRTVYEGRVSVYELPIGNAASSALEPLTVEMKIESVTSVSDFEITNGIQYVPTQPNTEGQST